MSVVSLKVTVDDEQFRVFEERVRRVREDLVVIGQLLATETLRVGIQKSVNEGHEPVHPNAAAAAESPFLDAWFSAWSELRGDK